MMAQYFRAKRKHPHALLLFRMGDFYELFFEDAEVASRVLGLTLTSRSKEKDVPMAGVPVRSVEAYITRLVRAGHAVAICEQLQDPRDAKGLVDRDVVRVVSPGTLVEDSNLQQGEPLYVLAVCGAGLAWADISTGRFRCVQGAAERLGEDLARIAPAEIVLADDESTGAVRAWAQSEGTPVTLRPPWTFDAARGRRDLCEQLQVATLEAFGVEELPEVLGAAGALLTYLRDTQKGAMRQIRDLELSRPSRHLALDRATLRTLEVTRSQRDGGREGTLLSVLDRTGTPMGARTLREWLLEPLLDAGAIRRRQDAVAELVDAVRRRRALAQALDGLGDLQRLAGRLGSGRAGARDLVSLASALQRVPALRATLEETHSPALTELVAAMDSCDALAARIRATLADDPPLSLRDGGLLRPGFSAELDELRALARGGRDYLLELQKREIQRTGIQSLKVGYNRVFGYYLEITHANAAAVPADYVRKQTLKNAERYITPELKEYEARVLGADERAKDLEYELFLALREGAAAELARLLRTAAAIAELDAYVSLASVAAERGYCRPELVDDDLVLDIRDGRHPVVEAALGGEPFVPNDTRLGADARLIVLTGPNMSGKSTWLRQTALITLMAQAGSFVPARSARIGVVDRIYTRLGGGDDIARGASTFMVEMVETAGILRHASERSLLLLDEVGRGTSTFDGLAIAWAVCEHVHDRVGARCLFATHYHELTDLAAGLPRARNLNVAVAEWGDEIVFRHRIEEGGTDRSYGIHVARLAGIPPAVLARAREVLDRLERNEERLSRRILDQAREAGPATAAPQQASLFDLLGTADATLLSELLAVDPNVTSPIEAWRLLQRVAAALQSQ
ncbi:MAG: DNA mismatch repair protein MutS [Planctomycetota bacterium]|nr:MAG: DNA mismatch repair protein MutS [Planctomycetota bacterium]